MPPLPPPPPPDALDDAIDSLRTYASGLFDSAYQYVTNPPAPPGSPPPVPDAAQQAREQFAQKELGKRQAQLTSALKQLDQADELAAKQMGRKSYAAIASTAMKVCGAIDLLVETATTDGNTNTRLAALSQILTGLAALAPAEVRQPETGGNGNNGGA